MFVCSNIPSRKHADIIPAALEGICVEFSMAKTKKILLVCHYRPPNQDSDMFLDLSRLHDLLSKKKAEIIIMDDFNCDVLTQR